MKCEHKIFILFNLLLLFYSTQSQTVPKCKIYRNTEFLWWDTDCGKYCSQLGKTVSCNWYEYHSGCFCKNGFYRNKYYDCVSEKDCDQDLDSKQVMKCSKNEYFKKCGDQCMNQCENIHNPLACAHKPCQSGCFCNEGLFRNERGVCVIRAFCPAMNIINNEYLDKSESFEQNRKKQSIASFPLNLMCEANEEYTSCGDGCSEQCINIDKSENCPLTCQTGCFCKQNLFRTQKGICVPEDECPKKEMTESTEGSETETEVEIETTTVANCGPNEKHTTCGSKCSESCNILKDSVEKNCPPSCEVGCFCVEGFNRDKFGVCVPKDQCECGLAPLQCRLKNETYHTCGDNCEPYCAQKEKPECLPSCARGCFCEENYLRDDNGECVLPELCSLAVRNKKRIPHKIAISTTEPPEVCEANEIYSDCGNLCDNFCEAKFDLNNCPMTCEKGCFCVDGYKRNARDVCVETDHCNDKPECGPNQEYTECGQNCGSFCNDIGRDRKCVVRCETGCFCIAGHFKDDDGNCIEKSKCKITNRGDCLDNEEYKDCGTHCGETCEDLEYPIECPKECETGCFCENGFYRDIQGICVEKVECHLQTTTTPKPECAENEVYMECGSKCDESCEELRECEDDDCESGCFCYRDFFRNKNGECVPSDQCKGPEQCNECKEFEYYTDCGSDCGKSCESIDEDLECNEICYKGCFCKSGFYRDPNGECVTKNMCLLQEDSD